MMASFTFGPCLFCFFQNGSILKNHQSLSPMSSRPYSIKPTSFWSPRREQWYGCYWEVGGRWWPSPPRTSTIWMGLGSSADHSPSVTPHHRSRPDRCLTQTATWKHNSAQTQLSFHSVLSFSCILISRGSSPDVNFWIPWLTIILRECQPRLQWLPKTYIVGCIQVFPELPSSLFIIFSNSFSNPHLYPGTLLHSFLNLST